MSSPYFRVLVNYTSIFYYGAVMITLTNVQFYYTGGNIVLNDISLHIKKGDYVSILGENGAGKSTLVKLILKLEKPIYGSIDNTAVRIGYVPQKKDNLHGLPITVGEFLNSYRHIIKVKNARVIDEFLEKTGTVHLKHARIGDISGGQLQRVLIARALIGSPDVIILDEPSSGIDVEGQALVYTLIKNLHTSGHTIISVEHNLHAAVQHSTAIFHMSKGSGHLCSPRQYAREFLHLAEFTQGENTDA